MVRFRELPGFRDGTLIDAVLIGAAGTTNGPPDLIIQACIRSQPNPCHCQYVRDLLLLNVMYVIVSRSEDAVSAFC